MRHFVELTFASDNSFVMVAVEDVQLFSTPTGPLSVAGVGCVISLSDTTIHVKETYAEVKQKIVNLIN
jgi:hypothetical protein